MASDQSTRVWEAAYRQYGRAWETTARSRKGDPAAAREMAAASWAVAAAWRQIAAATTLPWWTLAAIESAAAAFEAQARDCEAREGNDDHDRG
jgi:lysozyme family protein